MTALVLKIKKGGRALFVALLCFALMATGMGTPSVAAKKTDALSTPQKNVIAYFRSVQNEDGGFPTAEGKKSSPATTAWVVMALESAGQDMNSGNWKRNGVNPADYLKNAKVDLESLNDYSRYTLACSAMGIAPEMGGENLTKKLLSAQQKNGQFALESEADQPMINAHVWAILALHSTGNSVKNKAGAIKWLKSAQNKDGGFGWHVGAESDPDDTAAVIQALVVMGEQPKQSDILKKALKYLDNIQHKDGGYGTSEQSNSASDAWVMQGLIAAGVDTSKVKAHLLTLQAKDGSFKWREDSASSPVMMSAYALTAISGKAHPVNKSKKVN